MMKKSIIALVTAVSAVTAYAAFDPQTIAFYSFNEGADGESALDAGFVNAVDDSVFSGSVTWTTDSPSLKYSKDIPGYILDHAGRLSTNVQSVLSGGGVTMKLENLASGLSGYDEWTIEYFFKVEEEEYADWSTFLKMDAGLCHNSEPAVISFVQTQWGASVRPFFTTNSVGYYPHTYIPVADYCGRWHHFALTYSSGQMKMYYDRTVKYTVNMTSSESAADQAVSLMNGTWKGRICAVRASSCARSADEMLVATVQSEIPEATDLGDDTLAFYPFNEASAGTSLSGRAVFDATDPFVRVGYPVITAGELVYDDDVPGKYIFTNAVCGAQPWFTDPKSLRFVKSAGSASTSSVDLGGVMSELAENGTGTVEFFWKMDSAETNEANWKTTFGFGSVFKDNLGNTRPLGGCIPLASRSQNNGEQYRKEIRLGADNSNGIGCAYRYPGYLEDDLWHHFAVVFDSGEVRMYCDYVQGWNIGGFETNGFHLASAEDIVDLRVGNGWYVGKVSCVRVSKKALATDEMLRASNFEGYESATITWHFDEKTTGETFSSVSNCAITAVSATPGLYVSSLNAELMADAGVSPLTVGGTVTYPSAVRRRRNIRDGENGEIVSSYGSAVRMDVYPGAETMIFSLGMGVSAPKAQIVNDSFTAETFFRYDQATWLRDVHSVPAMSRQRMTVFGVAVDTYNFSWELLLDNAASASPRLSIWATGLDRVAVSHNGEDSTALADGNWHHVAVTYDSETFEMEIYFDHEPYMSIQFTGNLFGFTQETVGYLENFMLGSWALNNHPFCGWFDACRVRRGVHPVSSFYRMERLDFGTQVIIR